MELTDHDLAEIGADIGTAGIDVTPDLLRSVADHFRAITEAEDVEDRDRYLLGAAARVLAVGRALADASGEESVRAYVEDAARRRQAAGASPQWLTMRYGIDPDKPEAAFDSAAVAFKERGEVIFGPRFRYEQDRLDDDHSWVNITRCYFNDFMRRHGRPELMPMFCAGDIPFTDELSKPQYGLEFERPTAMGLGDDVCRFRFSRR